MQEKDEVIVAVSGGFDPIHPGHIRMFKQARALGDKLVVIINNDNWLRKKKGYVFMKESERAEIIRSIRYVDAVFVTTHKANSEDMSVTDALKKLRPDIFANGGDRTKKNIPEVAVCQSIDCKMVFNVGEGGKIQSSSSLVDKAAKVVPRKVAVNIEK